jgi:hypothetical protein
METKTGATPTTEIVVVGQDQVPALIEHGLLDLQRRFQETFESVTETADQLLERTKTGEVEGALQYLDRMNTQVKKLARRPVWGTGWVVNLWEGTKAGARRKLLARKAIKTALEEQRVGYTTMLDNLERNVAVVIGLSRDAQKVSNTLQEAIVAMEAEKLAIEHAIANWDERDTDGLREAHAAVKRYIKAIGDAEGLKFLHDASVAQLETQRQGREVLCADARQTLPQIDVLLKQQLAQLISQLELRTATARMVKLREGVRAGARANARMVREDAVEVAKIASQPIIDDVTIVEVATDIMGTVDDVRTALNKGILASEDAARQARASREQIRAKLSELHEPTQAKELR